MRHTLTRATSGKYRDQIATVRFGHAITAGDVSLCLYDVTTLYFEAEHEDALRKAGYSKERRVDPRSWSACSSTGTGSPWRSAALRATRPTGLPLPLARGRVQRRADHHTITPKNSRKIENDVTKKAEPVWDHEQHPGSWRAV
jgi:hypothetical protein